MTQKRYTIRIELSFLAFNDHHGFPYAVQSRRMQDEAFETEKEATDFATRLSLEAIK